MDNHNLGPTTSSPHRHMFHGFFYVVSIHIQVKIDNCNYVCGLKLDYCLCFVIIYKLPFHCMI